MMIPYEPTNKKACPVCSKSGKIAESRYTKFYFRQKDGKMPRLEFEMNGEKESLTIHYCPQCGQKLW